MTREFAKGDLRFYYDGKNNTSSTTHGDNTSYWHDLSGHNRTATLIKNAPNKEVITAEVWGENYLDFNAESKIEGGVWIASRTRGNYPILAADKNITCEVFFESPEELITQEQGIIGSYFVYNEIVREGFFIYTATSGQYKGNIVVKVCTSNGSAPAYCITPLTPNKKTLISLVIKDNNTIYIYINGILKNTFFSKNNFILCHSDTSNSGYSNPFIIGGSPRNHFPGMGWSNSHVIDFSNNETKVSPRREGKIYSARLYGRALSDNEIYYNYLAELEHLAETETPDYPDIPDVEPDIGDIIVPIEDGEVSKISIDNEELYNIKDAKSRMNKIDKYQDDTAYSVVNFMNGIKIDLATVKYDVANNTVIFK